ncbi:protein kinase [Actinotignum urinale]|uniref:protein kinase domain-containing protein n=1 Tax=Actinotignum urinale TaxID=190146 RepID=UPI00370D8BF9
MHSFTPGTTVDGRYVLRSPLASGGMAHIWLAHDSRLGRDVALKAIRDNYSGHPDFEARFDREARAIASLSNPHIVNIFDRGYWQGQAYIVMEYIPGPNLRQELRRLGTFPLGHVLNLMEQNLQGLSTAHRAGIIHRDIKPDNILLDAPLPSSWHSDAPMPLLLLADFGLARPVSFTTTAQAPRMVSVAYCAPEILDGETASPASDIYSEGILFYELLMGRPPFLGESMEATARMHRNQDIPRVTDTVSWIPKTIDSLIGLWTAKDISRRPHNATVALRALKNVHESIEPEILKMRVPLLQPQHETPVLAPGSTPESEPGSAPEFTPRSAPGSIPPVVHPSARNLPTGTETLTPTRKRAKPRRKIFRSVLAHSGLLLLATGVGVGVAYIQSTRQDTVVVPDVKGQTVSEARKMIEKKGLVANTVTEKTGDSKSSGRVILTQPAAGKNARTGDSVTLRIAP